MQLVSEKLHFGTRGLYCNLELFIMTLTNTTKIILGKSFGIEKNKVLYAMLNER